MSAPLPMRPGVFKADECEAELAAARTVHGPDYGRAVMQAQRAYRKTRLRAKAIPVPLPKQQPISDEQLRQYARSKVARRRATLAAVNR